MLGTRLHSLSAAVAVVLISINWPLISSLRLLRAPALPEPSLFTPYSLSHTPDVLLLNGGAMDSTQQLGSQPAAGHPAAAAAAAVLAPPPPPEPPPFNSSSTNSSNGSFRAHDATYQPTGISRDGMFIMILIFMLMITIPVGFALDGPMRVLLNAAKPYSNRFSEGLVSCVSTVWNTFLAYCAVAVVSAIAAVHCAVLAANAVIVAPISSAAARLRTAAAAAVCCCLLAMTKSSSCCCKQHVQQEADIQALPTVTAASSQSTTAAAAAAGAVNKNMIKGCNPEIHNSHVKDAVNVVGENQSSDNVVVEMGQVSNTTNNNSSSSSSCCRAASGSDSSSCPECKDTHKQQLEQAPDQQQTDGDTPKTSRASDRVASLAAAAAAPEGVTDDECELVHDDQRIVRDRITY